MIITVQFTLLLSIFLIVLILNIALRMVLSQLNISHLRSFGDRVPKGFEYMIDQKTLARMRDYTVATSRLGSIENLLSDLLILVFAFYGDGVPVHHLNHFGLYFRATHRIFLPWKTITYAKIKLLLMLIDYLYFPHLSFL